MTIEVYFNRPERPAPIDELIDEIRLSQARIVLASAWFTDVGIAQAILDSRAKRKIVILNRTDMNREDRAAYKRIVERIHSWGPDAHLELVIAGGTNFVEGVMHHKFCVIDYRIVWTGSFNFTVHARRNYEALLRIEDPVVNGIFWEEAEYLAAAAWRGEELDDGLERCSKCRRPITPDNSVVGWNSEGDVWCEICCTPE